MPWHIRDAHQPQVAILAIQPPARHRLIQILEPVRAHELPVGQHRLQHLPIGRAAFGLGVHHHHPGPERSPVAGAEMELGEQRGLVDAGEFLGLEAFAQ